LRSPVPFFLLTFAVAWACWIPVVRGGISYHSPLGAFLLLLGTFAPGLVATMLTARSQGNAGVRDLFGRIVRGPIAPRLVVFAVTWMAAIKLTAALIHRLAFGGWPRFGTESFALLPFAIALSTPVQAGEELGWRGYALPRMADRIGLAAASVVLGVIWAVWHLPLFFLAGADTQGQSFPLFLTQVIAASVALAWVFTNSRGGLLLPMLLHAAINNTKDIVPSATPGAADVFSFHASRIAWIGATLLWISALAMLAWMVRTEPRRAERETPA